MDRTFKATKLRGDALKQISGRFVLSSMWGLAPVRRHFLTDLLMARYLIYGVSKNEEVKNERIG